MHKDLIEIYQFNKSIDDKLNDLYEGEEIAPHIWRVTQTVRGLFAKQIAGNGNRFDPCTLRQS